MLRTRVAVLLCATAAGAIMLALALQHRSLASDLQQAAQVRLSRATRSVELLTKHHLQALQERYTAVAGTPQFRANLEVDDPGTLAYYAQTLQVKQNASRILFLDAHARVMAASGAFAGDAEALAQREPALLVDQGQPYMVASVELLTAREYVGRLVAVERLSKETLADWSQLCGADLVFGAGEAGEDSLDAVAIQIQEVPLRVVLSLAPEINALAHSRRQLIVAGLIALFCAGIASIFISNGLVRPIKVLTQASRRIGEGKLETRVRVRRSDELGELASAQNEMAARLQTKNEELRTAKELAETASRAKTNFLANISHEIRTPMTAILGFTNLLAEENADPATRTGWQQSVRRNGEDLMRLINSILDISRIESDQFDLHPQHCDLPQLLEDVADRIRPAADRKGLSLSVTSEQCPRSIYTDPTRLRQILVNLLENAVKFTEQGSVRLGVGSLQTNGVCTLFFNVVDTGIGIETAEQEQIFEAFCQADNSATRNYGGTGLGLSIANLLAQRMEGTLSVESVPGRGSAFLLTLPLAESPSAPDPVTAQAEVLEVDAATLAGRVLIAEDCPDNQRLLRALLRRTPLELEIVENGALACERALSEWSEGQPFNLILMDMQMPVLDGYGATRRLRAEGYSHPIVALTAHALPTEIERCLHAGCDGYATKPIDRPTLLATIAQFLEDPKDSPG